MMLVLAIYLYWSAGSLCQLTHIISIRSSSNASRTFSICRRVEMRMKKKSIEREVYCSTFSSIELVSPFFLSLIKSYFSWIQLAILSAWLKWNHVCYKNFDWFAQFFSLSQFVKVDFPINWNFIHWNGILSSFMRISISTEIALYGRTVLCVDKQNAMEFIIYHLYVALIRVFLWFLSRYHLTIMLPYSPNDLTICNEYELQFVLFSNVFNSLCLLFRTQDHSDRIYLWIMCNSVCRIFVDLHCKIAIENKIGFLWCLVWAYVLFVLFFVPCSIAIVHYSISRKHV